MHRVLIFPAGEMNAAELCLALSRQVNIELYGASSVERLGHHLFSRYRGDLPTIAQSSFHTEFARLLDDWKIDLVIPTHDTVVQFFARNRSRYATRFLLPDDEAAEACRDKAMTYAIFSDKWFVPHVFRSREEIGSEQVFVKPRRGQGAVGARSVDPRSIEVEKIDWDSEVVCEFLPGTELTVDCFSDRLGRLLGVFPRTRNRTLGGIAVSGSTVEPDEDIFEIAHDINSRLRFLGMWFFQLKKSREGRWKLLEISARCSGSQCLTRARGVNLPLLSVYAALGRDVVVFANDVKISMERMLLPLYDFNFEYSTVYLDYDDTVVCGDEVNPDVAALLFQWRNDKKSVILITRHEGILEEHLQKMLIDQRFFSRIIHLNEQQNKADYIERSDAVFIDNSFSERRSVFQKCSIPVFDVEGVQVLRKWVS